MTEKRRVRRRRVRGKALLVAGSISLLGLVGCDDMAAETEAEEAPVEEVPVGNLVAPEPVEEEPVEEVEEEGAGDMDDGVEVPMPDPSSAGDPVNGVADPEEEEIPE